MGFFEGLIVNRTLHAIILAWISAQALKTIVDVIRNRSFSFERLYGSGGMPSSHSAMVTALAVSVAKYCGSASTEFAISLCVATIVIYDAMGVRRQAGEHAKALNLIVQFFQTQMGTEENKAKFNELKELIGHTPLEVFSGMLLGIVLGIFI